MSPSNFGLCITDSTVNRDATSPTLFFTRSPTFYWYQFKINKCSYCCNICISAFICKVWLWILRRDQPLIHISVNISLITKHILDHYISLKCWDLRPYITTSCLIIIILSDRIVSQARSKKKRDFSFTFFEQPQTVWIYIIKHWLKYPHLQIFRYMLRFITYISIPVYLSHFIMKNDTTSTIE